MGHQTFEYPCRAQNTVKRYNNRASYDLSVIHNLVNSAPVLHVSFSPSFDDPFPAILPLIGQMGSFDRPSANIDEPLECYLHGYVSSRIMNLTRKAVENGGKGLPICIAATKVDGLVLTLTPNSHSYNYRSVVLFGYATLVTSVEEKLWAMELITNSVVPDRWANTRTPPNGAEMQSTQILRIEIDSGSAKVRGGPPNDDRADRDDVELVDRVWTGVVPFYEQLGEPIPSLYNKVQEVSEHISEYLKDLNQTNVDQAIEASK